MVTLRFIPWRLLLAPVCLLVLIAPSAVAHYQTAYAGSYSLGDTGNCNNWVPYGYSYTSWQDEPSNASGSVHGRLDHLENGSWVVYMDQSDTVSNTGYGTASVTNNWGFYEYGTGSWQEEGWHWGTFFSGVNYQYQHIWCG